MNSKLAQLVELPGTYIYPLGVLSQCVCLAIGNNRRSKRDNRSPQRIAAHWTLSCGRRTAAQPALHAGGMCDMASRVGTVVLQLPCTRWIVVIATPTNLPVFLPTPWRLQLTNGEFIGRSELLAQIKRLSLIVCCFAPAAELVRGGQRVCSRATEAHGARLPSRSCHPLVVLMTLAWTSAFYKED